MSDAPQGPGWWQASDGRFYAPEHHPNYVAPAAFPAESPVSTNRGCVKWGLMAAGALAALLVVAVALFAAAALGGGDGADDIAEGSTSTSTTGRPTATTRATTTTAVPASTTTVSLPRVPGGSSSLDPDFTTSDGRPMTAEEAGIVVAIDAIYPGIEQPRYILNWADYLCGDIDEGLSGEQLRRRAVMRFAGGDRPDPTPAQAAQIIELIESSGWCASR